MKMRNALRSLAPDRRGTALVLVLLLTAAVAALATSAIYLTSNGVIITRYLDRERDFRYAAEAALAQGKARLVVDRPFSDTLPDHGYIAVVNNGTINGADGQPIPGVRVSTYVGRTGNFTGQFGLFASIVSVANDASGARYVRRLEVQEENFAKWAVFANSVPSNICYARGEVINGPFWANTSFNVCAPPWFGGRFTDYVGTVGTVGNKPHGEFVRTPAENQSRIDLPTIARLSRLTDYATNAGYSFNNGTVSGVTNIASRLEFVTRVVDGVPHGFFRVWNGTAAPPVRVNASEVLDGGVNTILMGANHGARQCGLLIAPTAGDTAFIPYGQRGELWVATWLTNNTTMDAAARDQLANGSVRLFFNRPGRRCFSQGDPHLNFDAGAGTPGTRNTFVAAPPSGGSWVSLASKGLGAAAAVTAALGSEADYLFPLSREFNPQYMGVIHFTGSIAVHGVVRGRVTVYTPRSVGFLDDLVYLTSPNALPKRCQDLLGIIAGESAHALMNALNFPLRIDGANPYLFMGGNNHWFFDGVVMAVGGAHAVENFAGAPTAAQAGNNNCNGTAASGGCIFQNGGMIVRDLAATFTLPSGRGMAEARNYDTCMATLSPPYFPTTGRYLDNRFYEIDPVRFDVATLFSRLTPAAP